jgi:hypothetical protein
VRLALLLLAAAACTEHGSRPHLEVNVTSVPGTINVFRPDADLCCTATAPFPEPEMCVRSTDTSSCTDCSTHPSCFTSFDLEGDLGSKLQVEQPGMDNVLTFSPPFDQTELTLVARGCGDDIRVPIPMGGPLPHLTTSGTNGDVTWTTDRPAAGAIVTADSESCQTTASSHQFTHSAGSVFVLTFDPPTVFESATATVTLYSGQQDGFVPL